jgi:DnaJ-class molecular chaperone
MTFYQTLGLNKNASQEEIKQSYKKLILQHHPDKGGNAEEFKKIQEAYETLGDPNKRRVYDNPRPSRQGIHINFQNGFAHIIREFHKPIERINITTTFKELYLNFSKEIDLPYNIKFQYPLHKTKLQLLGEPSNFLIVNQISEIPPNFQIINNFDIMLTKQINFYECISGTTFVVELPNETLNLKKTPIIKDQDVFSIPNKGLLKTPNSEQRGNLLLKFVLIYPTLNEEKLKMLKNIFNESLPII